MKSKIRLLFQIVMIALIVYVVIAGWDVETFCPLGGLLSFGTQLYQDTMACNMSTVAIFMALALFIGALAIGKLFCSYLCPIGSISEWFGKLGKKLKLHLTLPTLPDRILRIFKYALLFVVFYYTVTASELFCRKFDPYFGMVTGFGHDVVLWWSLGAVVITILGAILFKQFWCKYFCPLGAISNMFVNIYLVLVPFALFIVIRIAGVNLSIAWLFGALALVGYAWEVGFFKFIPLPLTKITIDQNKCTQCQLCAQACPQGIAVHKYEKVNHPDCMMCTECVHSCTSEEAITVNNSKKLVWLPPVMVIILPLFTFLLSFNFEFKTLEKKWGEIDKVEKIAKYHQTDLKNVKCYGSSMALYKKLKDKRGIYGLDAYAKSHSVTIYYDPEQIDVHGIKECLFDPMRYKTRNFVAYEPDSLGIWEVGIENLFDRIDNMNLIRALHDDAHVFGFETNYGEPVIVRIFHCADSTNPANIRKIIDETKRVEKTIRDKKHVYEMDFTCVDEGRTLPKVATSFYKMRMFGFYDQPFNGYENWNIDDLNIYEIGMAQAENFMIRRMLPFMVSHISADSSIVRFTTTYNNDRTVAHIYYDPKRMTPDKIQLMLEADTLTFFKGDNTTGTRPNIFSFEKPGVVYKASEYVDSVKLAKEMKLGVDNEM